MLGVEKRIGASRYCRKCGGYHCMPNHHCGKGTVSPLQDAQMVIEDLEEFLVKAPIKIRAREEVEKWTSILREKLKIPKEKIYCERFYFPEEIKNREQLTKAFEGCLGPQRKKKGIRKKETVAQPIKSDYSYNHSREILEISADIFGKLKEILDDNLFVTESSKKEYDSIIKLVKEKVLKLN